MQLLLTVNFLKWMMQLKDGHSRGAITQRLDRLADGNPGDSRSLGGGIVELRIDFGPGFRVYYLARSASSAIVIGGGDKSTQDKDIAYAKAFVAQLKANN